MGIYGYIKNTTPHIDECSKGAIVFSNAMMVIPITYPSFVALFTGQHPGRSKIDRNSISQKISSQAVTLPSLFKKKAI